MIEKFKFLCPCLQLQTMPKRNHFHQLHHILFLSLSALLFSPVFSSSSEKSSPPADAGALLDFKSKADLHNSLHFHFTPDGSSSFCRWRGVQCSQLRVVRLVLEDTNLSGIFAPDTLTRLDQLRVLSLRNDSLTGTIPDLSALVNLKALYLDHNSFSGYFPPSISNLHRIRTVDFSFNNLTGQLPTWLTRLSRLYYLRLQFNRFNGTIPPLNQSTLSVFNVSGNNLFGPIPVTEALSSFNLSAYSSNPGLCGVIIHRECRPKIPFFGPAAAAGPMAETPGFPPLGLGVGQTSQLHSGVDVTKRRSSRHGEAVIWGFSAGVFVLIGCLFCFAIAAQSRRRKGSQLGGGEGRDTMARDTAATVDAAEVMRTDEEMEEKVKMAAAEQGMKAAVAAAVTKSGSLVFCAGEAQLYTLDQLMRASAELLGRGTMGATYKAVLDNRLIVCVKRLDAAKMGSAGKEAFVRHMESVGGLRHQNLVPLRAYFQAKEERLLVYDYQANGSLSSLIHGSKSARAKPLHWTSCLKIAEDVAQGLSYIHQAWRLVHGNLKSTNVLLGSDFEACLTDYCIAALASDPAAADEPSSGSGSGSSAGYRAPEIRRPASSPHMYSSVNSKADVYAFGVLLLELLTGKSPSQHPSSMAPKEMVKWVRSVRDVDDADEENRLIMLSEVAVTCRMSSPDQRPTMWQVLRTLQDIKEAVVLEDHDQLDPLSLSG